MKKIVLIVFLFFSTHCSYKEKVSNKQEKPSEKQMSCKQDSDCALVQDGPCGCRAGGKQKAILKSKKQSHLNSLRRDVFCPAVISKHTSCAAKKARCYNGQCILGTGI